MLNEPSQGRSDSRLYPGMSLASKCCGGAQVAALQAAKLAKARDEEQNAARLAKVAEIARRKEQTRARNAADALAKLQQR